MNGSLGRRLMAGAAALTLGGLGAVAVQAPAYAADFSAPFTCTAPVLGTQNVTIDGSLTATPNPAAVGAPAAFALRITQISLRAPVAINSWTMTANLDVSGAETTQFPITGSGGRVPANQPITGSLAGTWTPTVAGVDEFRGGTVTVKANVVLLGAITVDCVPGDTRPVAETLTVS
ncbi:hypothetical protein [Actinoplanes sp. NPDC051859]|uniref:hypothetical protein n=1 Tax=Actinoplanes sp. NPDC051859 TaxID=3363909 RepID=UPI0037AE0AE0